MHYQIPSLIDALKKRPVDSATGESSAEKKVRV